MDQDKACDDHESAIKAKHCNNNNYCRLCIFLPFLQTIDHEHGTSREYQKQHTGVDVNLEKRVVSQLEQKINVKINSIQTA